MYYISAVNCTLFPVHTVLLETSFLSQEQGFLFIVSLMSCHYSYSLLYNDKSSAFNGGNTEQPTALLISMFPQSRSNSDVPRDDSQRRFLAQDSVGSLLRHRFEWLQHCSNIVTLCCAKTRRCESFLVTSP